MSKFKEFLLVLIILVIIWAFPIVLSVGVNMGYRKGQVDYQKGIIEYKVEEVTTDVIRRLK